MINMGKRGLDTILLPFAHEELRACSGGSCYCEALLPVVYPDLDVRLGDGKSTRKYTPKGRKAPLAKWKKTRCSLGNTQI